MKKSLSVLVATAMVSSIFASVAFAADTLTTQQKLDALIAAGVFDKDGTGNGSELDANMSREQLAKILFKLKSLKEVTGTSYTDVASDRWSAGFIQAVSKTTPPLMDGVATGVFDPAGEVTLEQLATVAVRALGLQQNTSATVKGNVSEWAKGYVAAAIANGLLTEKTDYTKPAIRAELVEASYSAQQAIAASEKPAKASIKSVKAAGVQKVEVTLDRDVDTTKATFSLKKASLDIALDATKTTWSEDKKTATLTLKDAKINEGEYTVTLGGLAADAIGTATGSFTAEKEAVKKIEFSTASDTIAQSTKARVQFRAVNQYGENVSLNAGSFTVNTPGFSSSISKDNMGTFVVTIDTTTMTGGQPSPGLTVIPVYIYENDSRVSIQQNFKLGTPPFVQKMELGDVKYPAGKTSLSANGDFVLIPATLFDQYGNPMAFDSNATWNENVFTTPYSMAFQKAEFKDFDNDNFGELKIILKDRVEKTEEYTVTAQIGGASATTKVKVASAKLATKIQIGEPTDALAEGDIKDIYIPILAYDADGNQLSVDDIVDSQNKPRINISAQGVVGADLTTAISNASIEEFGQYKGHIHIGKVTGTANSQAFISAYLTSTTGNNSYVTKSIPIMKARTPDKIKVVTENATKTAGGNSNVRFSIVDLNDKQLDRVGSVVENGNSVTYRVYGQVTGNGGLTLQRKDRLETVVATYNAGDSFDIRGENFDDFNQIMTFNAAAGAAGQSLELKVGLQKSIDGGATWTAISNVITKKIEYINAATENLTYTVSKPTSMYAALDPDMNLIPSDIKNTTSNGNGKYRKAIELSAKDASGNTVAISNKRIISVSSSVYSVAQATPMSVMGTGYIHGVKAGKSTITVQYKDFKDVQQFSSFEIEVKNEVPVIQSVTANSVVEINASDIGLYDKAYKFMTLTLKDQYGVSFTKEDINKYDNITGVFYSIEGTSAVTVDAKTGVLSGLASGQAFTLKAVTATGQVVSTFVRIH